MRARERSWLLAAASAVLVAGCGAGRPHETASAGALFGEACSACHTLSGADDPRRQGGDLLHFHSGRTQLFELAREMPVRRPLTVTQLRAVVGYVMAVERRHS